MLLQPMPIQAALADTAAINANDKAQTCTLATQNANDAAAAANQATQAASLIKTSLENLTVSSESGDPNTNASATMTNVDGHLDIHFTLKQGEQGDPFIIKGSVYPTLAALQAAITSPLVGDQYNVGGVPPYLVYRWTGTTNGWENQGTLQGPKEIGRAHV